MASLLERINHAMNSHDPVKVAALFADDYQSSQPVHPNRGFGGRQQVAQNWAAVFDGVPDFRAELVAASVDGETEWGEWEWRGTHADGSSFLMRGSPSSAVGTMSSPRLGSTWSLSRLRAAISTPRFRICTSRRRTTVASGLAGERVTRIELP